jgi:hypothetical protein
MFPDIPVFYSGLLASCARERYPATGHRPWHLINLCAEFSQSLACASLLLEVAGKYMNEEMEDHQEVEWQFDALDVRPVSKWLQRDWQGRDPSVVSGETRELTDDYFDTEDWSIYRAGYALRIRHKG